MGRCTADCCGGKHRNSLHRQICLVSPSPARGDTITIGNGDTVHEIDITVSDEEYEAIRQTIPDEKADDPSTPIYHVGDTVYLENQEYRITELREDTVQLLPTA